MRSSGSFLAFFGLSVAPYVCVSPFPNSIQVKNTHIVGTLALLAVVGGRLILVDIGKLVGGCLLLQKSLVHLFPAKEIVIRRVRLH